MNNKILIFVMIISIVFISSCSTDTTKIDKNVNAEQTLEEVIEPYVNVNIVLEIKGINQATQTLADATEQFAEILKELGENEPSSEQKKMLKKLVSAMSESSVALSSAIEKLPDSLAASREPLTEISDSILANYRNNGAKLMKEAKDVGRHLIALFTICVLILLYAAFWFLIRPIRNILVNVEKTAGSIEATVKAVNHVD